MLSNKCTCPTAQANTALDKSKLLQKPELFMASNERIDKWVYQVLWARRVHEAPGHSTCAVVAYLP